MSQETFPVYFVGDRKFLTKRDAITFAGVTAGLDQEDVGIDVVNIPVSLDRSAFMKVTPEDCPIKDGQ